MRLVVADTSPINYLLLIEHIHILPSLFERMILPVVVYTELRHPTAPKIVAEWIAAPPDWVEIRGFPGGQVGDSSIELNPGEEDATALAIQLHADLLLIDDEDGVTVARSKGLEVTGALGLLTRAAQRRLLDLRAAIDRLKQTNFRCRLEVIDRVLAGYASRKFDPMGALRQWRPYGPQCPKECILKKRLGSGLSRKEASRKGCQVAKEHLSARSQAALVDFIKVDIDLPSTFLQTADHNANDDPDDPPASPAFQIRMLRSDAILRQAPALWRATWL